MLLLCPFVLRALACSEASCCTLLYPASRLCSSHVFFCYACCRRSPCLPSIVIVPNIDKYAKNVLDFFKLFVVLLQGLAAQASSVLSGMLVRLITPSSHRVLYLSEVISIAPLFQAVPHALAIRPSVPHFSWPLAPPRSRFAGRAAYEGVPCRNLQLQVVAVRRVPPSSEDRIKA